MPFKLSISLNFVHVGCLLALRCENILDSVHGGPSGTWARSPLRIYLGIVLEVRACKLPLASSGRTAHPRTLLIAVIWVIFIIWESPPAPTEIIVVRAPGVRTSARCGLLTATMRSGYWSFSIRLGNMVMMRRTWQGTRQEYRMKISHQTIQ